MLIKTADDRSKDLEALQALLAHPRATAQTRTRIEQEMRNMRVGAKGEAEAAYEIDFHHKASRNWAVIHDLRIEYQGRVAQIDHLLINRVLEFWVCESKHFSEGVAINEEGEILADCIGTVDLLTCAWARLQDGSHTVRAQARRGIEAKAHGVVPWPIACRVL